MQANTKMRDTTIKLTYPRVHVNTRCPQHDRGNTYVVDFLYPWQQRTRRPVVPTREVERPAEGRELDACAEALGLGLNHGVVCDTRMGSCLDHNGIAHRHVACKVAQFDVAAGCGRWVSGIGAFCGNTGTGGLHALTRLFLPRVDRSRIKSTIFIRFSIRACRWEWENPIIRQSFKCTIQRRGC